MVAAAEGSVVLLYLLLNGGLVNLLIEGLNVERSVVGTSVVVDDPILNLPLDVSVFAAGCSSFCSVFCCCRSLSLILFKLKRGLV